MNSKGSSNSYSDKTRAYRSMTIIRHIMINKLGIKYKRGLSRLIDYNEERQLWMKQWFAVKLSMLLKNFELLINIDESSFSRFTKKNYSWIPKGKAQVIKNICFRNSCSLVITITSSCSAIAAKSSGWVNSKLFIIFLKELIRFIKEIEQVEQQKVLILLDNASIHRSGKVKEILENENMNVAYIPQYSPELAPIEHYFSKLKQVVIGRSREKNIIGSQRNQMCYSSKAWRTFRQRWWEKFGLRLQRKYVVCWIRTKIINW